MNLRNRSIYCHDNLDILRGIDSESVDLIYLDPPFNKKKIFAAPMGSSAEGASFSDVFRTEDVKEEWLDEIAAKHRAVAQLLNAIAAIEGRGSYNFCYLAYMAIRLLEMHRILQASGSLYLHCDPTMSHHLKLLLDCIFGESNFRNQIIWNYRKWTNAMRHFQANHDVILVYSATESWTFNRLYQLTDHKKRVVEKGYDFNVVQDKGRKVRQMIVYDESKARAVAPERYDKIVDRTEADPGTLLSNVWTDINYLASGAKERTGYPTQKPLALLERIISASSREGDMVLDPFCGCGTTCLAAERLGRQWVGIDISRSAYDMVKARFDKEAVEVALFTESLEPSENLARLSHESTQ